MQAAKWVPGTEPRPSRKQLVLLIIEPSLLPLVLFFYEGISILYFLMKKFQIQESSKNYAITSVCLAWVTIVVVTVPVLLSSYT